MPYVSYEDIRGLKDELQKVREMIELPLRHPEIFEKLGMEAPKGSAVVWTSRNWQNPACQGSRKRE